MKAVSAIIPTFNRAILLDRCLRSLLESGVPDLEVIVVDDGGNDESETVCRSRGVSYLRQSNAGPAAARNLGFAASQGRYVVFIDSDDEWINGGVSRLVRQLDANPDVAVGFADSAMGNFESGFVSFVETYGGDAFSRLPRQPRPESLQLLERRHFLLQLSTRNVMFLGSMLFRRDAFAALGGFDRGLRGAADWDLFMRATVAGRVGYSDGPPISRYYKHETAMSADSDHMEADFIRALDSVRRRCELDPIERRHIDRRLREHLFGWAYRAYDAGNFPVARERLQLARQLNQAGMREVAFMCATYFPPGVIGALRRTRHAMGL